MATRLLLGAQGCRAECGALLAAGGRRTYPTSLHLVQRTLAGLLVEGLGGLLAGEQGEALFSSKTSCLAVRLKCCIGCLRQCEKLGGSCNSHPLIPLRPQLPLAALLPCVCPPLLLLQAVTLAWLHKLHGAWVRSMLSERGRRSCGSGERRG